MAKMAAILELLKKPSFIFKIVELMLAILTTSLAQNSSFFIKNVHEVGFIYTATSGFVLILVMQILERIIEETTSKKMALTWSFIGVMLWFAAGGLIVNNYNYVNTYYYFLKQNQIKEMKLFLAAGIVAIVNAFVFVADLAITSVFE